MQVSRDGASSHFCSACCGRSRASRVASSICSVAQSSGQLIAVSLSSHSPLPQHGLILVCMHTPFSHLSLVHGSKSSHPLGHSSCVLCSSLSLSTVLGACASAFLTSNDSVSVFCLPSYAMVTYAMYCPSGASWGIVACIGMLALSFTCMLWLGTCICLGPDILTSIIAFVCFLLGLLMFAFIVSCCPGATLVLYVRVSRLSSVGSGLISTSSITTISMSASIEKNIVSSVLFMGFFCAAFMPSSMSYLEYPALLSVFCMEFTS